MSAQTLDAGDAAEVEICRACGSAFFEYFDGEPAELARALQQADRPSGDAAGTQVKSGCPDCGDVYDLMRYLDDGPYLFRCGSCMAVFATADQLRELAAFTQIKPSGSWLSSLLARL